MKGLIKMLQLSKIIEYFKYIINTKNKKKSIENAVIIATIGVIVIIAGSTFLGGSKKEEAVQPLVTAGNNDNGIIASSSGNTDIEYEIEKVLSQIVGAGRVTIMITYSSGKEIVPVTDTKKTGNVTLEKDNGGGTRDVNESNFESSVVYEDGHDGTKKAVIAKELLPQVKGVVVVADGAGDIGVRDNLLNAVQVLVDIPIHRIKVFQRNK